MKRELPHVCYKMKIRLTPSLMYGGIVDINRPQLRGFSCQLPPQPL